MRKASIIIWFILIVPYTYCSNQKIESRNRLDNDMKIEAIANLYGYARYFYPNKYAEDINWYKFLMHTLKESKKIDNNPEKVAEFLYQSFSPLIPEMQISILTKTFGMKEKDREKSPKSFYIKEHYGMGGKNVFGTKMPYYSKVVKKELSDNLPIPDSLYSYPICAGITLRYPLAISTLAPSLKKNTKNVIQVTDSIDLRTTSSLMKSLKNKPDVFKPIQNQDETLKIADIIIHWTVLRFFYPYLKEDGLDNEKMRSLLLSYTEKASAAQSFREYYFYILREFMGFFKDQHIVLLSDFNGQGLVGGFIDTGDNYIGLEYVNDKIVSQYNIKTQNNKKIKRGDILTAVNDIAVDSFLNEQLKYVSANTYTAKVNQCLLHGFQTLDTKSIFKYTFKKQNGDTLSCFRATNDKTFNGISAAIKPRNTDFIQDLGNGAFYILLSSQMFSVKAFEKFLTNTPSIRKIIFDLRQYPNTGAFELLGFFSEKPVKWGDYRLPLRYFPEQDKAIWEKEIETISPKQPTIKTSVYFLINSNTTSYGESMANTIKKNKIGILVGTNTSGTNGTMGNASVRLFPFTLSIGKDFDGYHGKGVTPDIEIRQTIEDYNKGLDSLILEFNLQMQLLVDGE